MEISINSSEDRYDLSMKWYAVLVVLLTLPVFTFAQKDTGVNVNNEIVIRNLAAIGAGAQNLGASSVIFNPIKNIVGSVHLFQTWNNTGVFVVPETNRKYLIRNINYNIRRGVFESQISKDTIFTFTFQYIDMIVVNSRKFKNMYVPALRGNKTFEVIYENDEFAILKDHYLTIREGSDNPMVKRLSRYEQQYTYQIKRGNSFKIFRMRKRNILELMGSEAEAAEAYAEEQRMSYKNDQDVKRLLTNFLGTKEE